MKPTSSTPEADPEVQRILATAVDAGASDVYFIPAAEDVKVRMRVWGGQQLIGKLTRELGDRCIARLKVLAGLLTYKTRCAQDGAIRDLPAWPGLEFRLAVMPTLNGERASLRLLGVQETFPNLAALGLPPSLQEGLRQTLEASTGMILLTGPTGSGKTTTIYALIRELLLQNEDPASILTIEDPVEQVIEGISQSAIAPASEWGYAEALRAALRQDVKTLVIGELRDSEIVRIALDAALSGHRIITTYHAGDIAMVYARLLHQGFEPFILAAAIRAVWTQRLLPGKPGHPPAPIGALFRADEAWTDVLATRPTVRQLREALNRYPLATFGDAG